MPITTVSVRQIPLHGGARRYGERAEQPEHRQKPQSHPAVAARARPTAANPVDVRCSLGVLALPAYHQNEVGGKHGETAWIQRRYQSGGKRQADQALVHECVRLLDVSAATRPESSCCDIAEVGLFTNVDVPSAR